MPEYYTNYLIHHGIKGQKWGQKNGPPYPLDDGDHSASEKKAGWRESLGPNRKDLQVVKKAEREDEKAMVDKYLSNLKEKTIDFLSDERVKTGLKIAAAVLAVYGAKVAYDKFVVPQAQEALLPALQDKWATSMISSSDFTSLSDIPAASRDYLNDFMDSKSEGAYKILTENLNPGWPNEGHKNNCMLCTTSIIMRLKGFEVKANTSDHGWLPGQVSDWFKGAKVENVPGYTLKSFKKAFTNQGDGAYGNLMVSWYGNGGHSIAYVVKDGKPHFIDGQVNVEWPPRVLHMMIKKHGMTQYARLDNCEPTELVLGALASIDTKSPGQLLNEVQDQLLKQFKEQALRVS